MWADGEQPYQGKFHSLPRPLNSPQPLSRPHPRILIGGGGEKKTLRLVAKYAGACNLFAYPGIDVKHKLDVLRGHCEAEGRDYDDIYKTCSVSLDLSAGTGPAIEQLRGLAELGFQTAIVSNLPDVHTLKPIETIGQEIIPAVRDA